jgi:acyl carrier protein
MESVEEKIRKYIAENILYSSTGYPYPDETSFLENGIVDSMNVMEIVMYTEEKFGVKVKDEDIVPANFDSVRNLAEFIRRNQVQTA